MNIQLPKPCDSQLSSVVLMISTIILSSQISQAQLDVELKGQMITNTLQLSHHLLSVPHPLEIQYTAVEKDALTDNIRGYVNTAIGLGALIDSRTGIRHTAVGIHNLSRVTMGRDSTALGLAAGSNLRTGNNNIAIVAGGGAQFTATPVSNQIQMGKIDICSTSLVTGWTITSDQRNQEQIVTSPIGLDYVEDLRPVVYHRKNRTT